MTELFADVLSDADRANRDPETWRCLRLVEAILFASTEPISASELAIRLPSGVELDAILAELRRTYAGRGVVLEQSGGRWAFRTASDLAPMLNGEAPVTRRLSRAATETLAIVAYHQPATRAEIEDIRGVAVSRGTIDILLEAEWVKPLGRRRSPGRPLTWGVTDAFLDHFGLTSRDDLPGLDELRHSGLLDSATILADSADASDPFGGEEDENLDSDIGSGDWSDEDFADAISEDLDADIDRDAPDKGKHRVA